MPGDLHTHTTFSDGSTPADKLPFLAACAGMTHLAISDHDSIRSVRYAYAHPVQNGVHLIPATELTAYDYERAHRVHLLCYWPDDCAALADFSAMMAERRLTAMLQSCKELEAICPQFRTEEALELAKDSGTLCSVTLVFIAVLLTGIGVFDDIARHAGAGTLVPITGFANAVASSAIDSRCEGLVLGVGAKIFTVAGPVLLYGTLAGFLYGVIYSIIGLCM